MTEKIKAAVVEAQHVQAESINATASINTVSVNTNRITINGDIYEPRTLEVNTPDGVALVTVLARA